MPTPKKKPAATKRPMKAKRDIRLPTRYSRAAPVGAGHDYLVRGVPTALWSQVIQRADREDVSVRTVILQGLEHYVAHGLPVEARYDTDDE